MIQSNVDLFYLRDAQDTICFAEQWGTVVPHCSATNVTRGASAVLSEGGDAKGHLDYLYHLYFEWWALG